MKRMLPLATFLALVLAAATAGADPGGNISWDRCWPEGGSSQKFFACNTNTGSAVLMVSFALPSAVTNFSGVVFTIDGRTADGSPLPAWWQLYNPGACRQTALSATCDFSAEPQVGCASPWPPGAEINTCGVGAYQTALYPPPFPLNVPTPDRLRIKGASGSGTLRALSAGVEYYACRLQIQYSKTVGAGSCAACDRGLCLNLTDLALLSNTGTILRFTYGPYYPPSDPPYSQPRQPGTVSWQCAAASWTYSAGPPPAVSFGCNPIGGCVVAVENRTWGSIKALYR